MINKKYLYAGIDYSMSCPAITIGTNKDYKKCKSFFYTADSKFEGKYNNLVFGIKQLPYEHQMERFENIADWTMAILQKFKVYEVCIEGYAMGAKGRIFDIAENTALVKYKMWQSGIKFDTPSPLTVKKYFTGKGNSNKEAMHDSFFEKTGIDMAQLIGGKSKDSPVSDIVDSYAMLCYGVDHYFN